MARASFTRAGSLALALVLMVAGAVQWYYIYLAARVLSTDSPECEFERYCRLNGGQRSSDINCRLGGPRDDWPNLCLTRKARWCSLYPQSSQCIGFTPSRFSTNWEEFYRAQGAVFDAAPGSR